MQPTAGAKRPSLTHGENPLPAAADAHRWGNGQIKRSDESAQSKRGKKSRKPVPKEGMTRNGERWISVSRTNG